MMSKDNARKSCRFGELEGRIGYYFDDHADLEKALTHSSARKTSSNNFHYERLEFLGDRVLGLCIAQLLHVNYPNANEGELSLRFNSLVKGETLSQIADELKLHEYIRTGGDLKTVRGTRMQNIRADVVEAMLASIYLDGGMKAAEEFILKFWSERMNDINTARRDSKTALQEWAHSQQMGTPRYAEQERSGPDHDPEFTVQVKLSNQLKALGMGRSKRLAEQEAAQKILIQEGVWKTPKEGKH